MSELKHLAVIMDGNRRWAKDKGLPSFEGHRQGYDKMKEVGQWCIDRGITTLTVYAFSTENWNREEAEVNYLMDLLYKAVTTEVEEFNKRGIRLKIIGTRERLSDKLVKAIAEAEERTKNNDKGTLNICLNYGGRLEIVDAVKRIMAQGVPADQVTEKTISENIWLAGQDDPDLIIRTSGEQRLSGFLTWESVYSEFLFIDKHWPAFSETDLDAAINDYNSRHRRFGGN
ncbi:MAG: Ditrans,polycis-undecaprenyl-diphosphate synthase ((2E,6E)-farnesyl-diphosphate specific) [Parcubacteria group bacterium ADurb.Bin326]|nr:MAG: Ditrans,polycis-undecaprenyl-diphosphate synthase ((2E,6E)-farnesyl-diphosphate specific) [Parcubacteria group bacterium ADurb.Bin326]